MILGGSGLGTGRVVAGTIRDDNRVCTHMKDFSVSNSCEYKVFSHKVLVQTLSRKVYQSAAINATWYVCE